MDLDLTLEVGAVSESVAVTGPGADAGHRFGDGWANPRQAERGSTAGFQQHVGLLTRFVPGANASAMSNMSPRVYVTQTTSSDYNSLGAVGGSEWTIDGATNNGSDRRLASSPNSEMIQEMRVETANFDASSGHGTGLGISMMTKSGANVPHGSANWQYWNNRWTSANLFQRQV